MSRFLTWVSNTTNELVNTDLRHGNRALEYLHSHDIEDKSVFDIVHYIDNWWPRAFKDDMVLKRLKEIVLDRSHHWTEEEAFEVYDSVVELKDDQQLLRTVFGQVPVLFFGKDALFNRFSNNIVTYYDALALCEQVKYAVKALSVNGYLIRNVPLGEIQDTGGKTKAENIQKLYEIAVRASPGAIKHVPEANRTPKMMRDAVRASAYALEYLAPHWQDEYLEDAIINPDDKRETHWPSNFWGGNRARVSSKRLWLQKIFDRAEPGTMVDLYKRWSMKKEREANIRQNEQSMI